VVALFADPTKPSSRSSTSSSTSRPRTTSSRRGSCSGPCRCRAPSPSSRR
jgi:hypothetical protein